MADTNGPQLTTASAINTEAGAAPEDWRPWELSAEKTPGVEAGLIASAAIGYILVWHLTGYAMGRHNWLGEALEWVSYCSHAVLFFLFFYAVGRRFASRPVSPATFYGAFGKIYAVFLLTLGGFLALKIIDAKSALMGAALADEWLARGLLTLWFAGLTLFFFLVSPLYLTKPSWARMAGLTAVLAVTMAVLKLRWHLADIRMFQFLALFVGALAVSQGPERIQALQRGWVVALAGFVALASLGAAVVLREHELAASLAGGMTMAAAVPLFLKFGAVCASFGRVAIIGQVGALSFYLFLAHRIGFGAALKIIEPKSPTALCAYLAAVGLPATLLVALGWQKICDLIAKMLTTEERPAPSGKKDTRYYSLDFWRGVACLMVVVYHSSEYLVEGPGGVPAGRFGKIVFHLLDHLWTGVPLFFVISGYCITAACDSTRQKSHPMRQYFFRRFRRIFPPFWVAVAVLTGAMLAAGWAGWERLYVDEIHPLHGLRTFSGLQWVGNLSLTESWRVHVIGPGRWFVLGPSWSLCYEEQFYALCGLMLILQARTFFRSAFWLTMAVAALAVAGRMAKWGWLDGFFFDGLWLLFAAGVLVYYCLHYATPRGMRLGIAALGVATVLALAWHKADKAAPAEYYYVGFAFAAMITVLYRWDRTIADALVLRPITYCGIMCYSLYLIHWPVVKPISHLLYEHGIRGAGATILVVVPLCVVAAAAAGWAFHCLVERRFLNTPPVMPWAKRPASVSGFASTRPEMAGVAVAGEAPKAL